MKNDQEPRPISAADIGTNTIKVTHALVNADGTILTLAEAAETIRLGVGIESSGQIAPDRMDACLSVLRDQEDLGRQLGSTTFAGVATETLRVASNGKDLLERIERETDWDIRILSGDDEAHLTWIGLRDQVPAHGTVLIVDIGGGSTEIIRIEEAEVASSISIPLGSGRLADHYFEADPPGIAALDAATLFARNCLGNVADLPKHADTVVFSGGNGLFIDQMIGQLLPNRVLSKPTVSALLHHFASTPALDTAERIGIAHERARVLPAGAAIALAMLQRVDAVTVASAPSGIRTGLIREITGA